MFCSAYSLLFYLLKIEYSNEFILSKVEILIYSIIKDSVKRILIIELSYCKLLISAFSSSSSSFSYSTSAFSNPFYSSFY